MGKDFYDPFSHRSKIEECDFESIAVGFFIASGLQPSEAFVMYEYCTEKGKY